MFFRILCSFLICSSAFLGVLKDILACESCLVPRIGRLENIEPMNGAKNWFFDFAFEQQNWDEKPAREAHLLHHDGHHFHDKTHEEFYHFTLGANPVERLTVYAEVPLVVRGSIEIENHADLGKKEESRGLGDAHFLGTYRVLEKGESFLGGVLGIKVPTGQTKVANSRDEIFEMELQPGTGSFDFPVGAIYQWTANSFVLRGNVMYVFKTEGDRQFEYGNLFSASLFLDLLVGPQSRDEETKIGLDLNFQNEQKQTENGLSVKDSGGNTLLLGPAVTLKRGRFITIYGSLLFPVYQELGGVHQELDYTWTAGGKVSW